MILQVSSPVRRLYSVKFSLFDGSLCQTASSRARRDMP